MPAPGPEGPQCPVSPLAPLRCAVLSVLGAVLSFADLAAVLWSTLPRVFFL